METLSSWTRCDSSVTADGATGSKDTWHLFKQRSCKCARVVLKSLAGGLERKQKVLHHVTSRYRDAWAWLSHAVKGEPFIQCGLRRLSRSLGPNCESSDQACWDLNCCDHKVGFTSHFFRILHSTLAWATCLKQGLFAVKHVRLSSLSIREPQRGSEAYWTKRRQGRDIGRFL